MIIKVRSGTVKWARQLSLVSSVSPQQGSILKNIPASRDADANEALNSENHRTGLLKITTHH